jgi:hypothetical protein
MRIFKGSSALMAPQYWEKFDYDDEADGRCYAAPEIVSHAGNAGWDGFYAQMNAQFINPAHADRYGKVVRCHQAKEFSVLPGMLSFLRNSYRGEKYKGADPLSYFAAIRDLIDPQRLFCNDYLQQFLYSEAKEYTPPNNTRIFTRGQQQNLDRSISKRNTGNSRPANEGADPSPLDRPSVPLRHGSMLASHALHTALCFSSSFLP